jgi:hypothetical protein
LFTGKKKKSINLQSNWLRLATRMNSSRMPKIMLNYRPNGRRRLGRPLKRLLDEAETGLSSFSLFHRAFFSSIVDKTPTHAPFTQHYIILAC